MDASACRYTSLNVSGSEVFLTVQHCTHWLHQCLKKQNLTILANNLAAIGSTINVVQKFLMIVYNFY